MKRAGLAGAVVGLDLTEAITTAELLGAEPDEDLVAYLGAIEDGAIAAGASRDVTGQD